MSKHEPTGNRVAIIGSGFGGLAAAIRLQSAGYDCVLFEARDKPGGRAYVYEVGDFKFDGGPTVITAPHCIEELFEVAGKPMDDYVELLPVTPFYRLEWDDGDSFDYTGNANQMRQQIADRSESDAKGYEKFLEYTRKVFAKGYEDLAATPFLKFFDMVRVAPDLAMLRADRSVYSTVAKFIKDEHLRQAFSFHSLLVGGNPFDTSSIYTLIHYLERKWGVFFPRGGTGALVQALAKVFEELGGEIRLSSPITQIQLEGGKHRVRSRKLSESSVTIEDFDLVVSNADLHHTYSRLYGGEPGGQRMTKRLEQLDWSMSLFVLYFGTDKVYDDVAHHTIVFGPRYKELLREIFDGAELPDDFSLYLHSPTVTDPSMAPEGCSSFYVLSPVPHLGNANIDWDKVGPKYADKILAHLETYLPELRQHVVAQHFITPNSFKKDLGAYQGSAFSVAPKLTQSAWFRPHNRDPNIDGLYIVGAGTHPGAGLPGVINSAKATADLILADTGRASKASSAA